MANRAVIEGNYGAKKEEQVLYNKTVPITESALLVLDAQDSFKAGHPDTLQQSWRATRFDLG